MRIQRICHSCRPFRRAAFARHPGRPPPPQSAWPPCSSSVGRKPRRRTRSCAATSLCLAPGVAPCARRLTCWTTCSARERWRSRRSAGLRWRAAARRGAAAALGALGRRAALPGAHAGARRRRCARGERGDDAHARASAARATRHLTPRMFCRRRKRRCAAALLPQPLHRRRAGCDPKRTCFALAASAADPRARLQGRRADAVHGALGAQQRHRSGRAQCV